MPELNIFTACGTIIGIGIATIALGAWYGPWWITLTGSITAIVGGILYRFFRKVSEIDKNDPTNYYYHR